MKTLEDRLRQGAQDIERAVAALPELPLQQRSHGPWVAVATAIAVLLLLGLPMILFVEYGASPADTATVTDSAPVGGDAALLPWQCPTVEPREDVQLDPALVPGALRYMPGNGTPDSAWGVNYGPQCFRSPALIAARFADAMKKTASALVVVWVEARIAEYPPDDASVPTTQVEAPRPGEVVSEVEGFELRHYEQPEGFDQVRMTGEIDGLPLFIESSGLAPEEVAALVSSMTASAATGEVDFGETGLEVIHRAPVNAAIADVIAWYVEGPNPGQSLELRAHPGYHAFLSARGATRLYEFLSVGDNVGVAAEEAGQASVAWEIQPGVIARLTDEGSIEAVVRLAESLAPAASGSNGDFPHLALVFDRWHPTRATGVFDNETGELIATEAEYARQAFHPETGEPLVDEAGNALIDASLWLTIRSKQAGSLPSVEVLELAESTETTLVDADEATIYRIPGEVTDGPGTSDTHAIRWSYGPGYEVVLVGWALDESTVLDLANQLKPIPSEAWLELTIAHSTSPTTIAPSTNGGG